MKAPGNERGQMPLAEEYFANENALFLDTLRQAEYNGRKLFVATGPRGLPQGACTSMIAYARMVNPDKGRRLREVFKTVAE